MAGDRLSGPFDSAPMTHWGNKTWRRSAQGDRDWKHFHFRNERPTETAPPVAASPRLVKGLQQSAHSKQQTGHSAIRKNQVCENDTVGQPCVVKMAYFACPFFAFLLDGKTIFAYNSQ